MRSRVRRAFIWSGEHYERGDLIRIPETHPRLDAMIRGGFLVPDPSWLDKVNPHLLGIGVGIAVAVIAGVIVSVVV